MRAEELLQAWAEKKGYRLAAAGLGVLEESRADIEKRLATGELDQDFHAENLTGFTYLQGSALENPLSVILVALPRPAHILTFKLGETAIDTVLPPTYFRYRPVFEEIRDEVRLALAGTGAGAEILNAPLKTLAARLGLAHYGRNNVCYLEPWGSYLQLVGLVSDLPVEAQAELRSAEEALLERCRKCRACQEACPTGAIGADRFLLYAQKCYTLFSESAKPIPENLQPPSPDCIIGCLKCQRVCPENKGRLKYEKAPFSFSAEETEAFLDLAEGTELRLESVRAKIQQLGLTEDPFLLARNLRRKLGLQTFGSV